MLPCHLKAVFCCLCPCCVAICSYLCKMPGHTTATCPFKVCFQ